MTDRLKNKVFPDSGVQWCGKWPKGFIEPNRKIYDYELVYFQYGDCRVNFDTVCYNCPAGSLIIIPPGSSHYSTTSEGTMRWCVHFDWYGDCKAHDFLKSSRVLSREDKNYIWTFDDGTEQFKPEWVARPLADEGMVFPFFRRNVSPEMLTLLQQYFLILPDDLSDSLKHRGLLFQILALALNGEEMAYHTENMNKTFFNTKSFIDSSYQNPETCVEMVADEFLITPNYLGKLFRKILGVSALDYIQTRRLERACMLLRHDKRTIREIAFASGFNDPNYFTRFFRHRFGITPIQYKREKQKEQFN